MVANEQFSLWRLPFYETNQKSVFGSTPLHYATLGKSLNLVEYLITCGSSVKAKNQRQETPLHWACRSGYYPIVEYLISSGADVNAKDMNGETPLHWACKENNLDACKLLVAAAAIVDNHNLDGETPLTIACIEGSIQVIEYLLPFCFHIDELAFVAVENDQLHTLKIIMETDEILIKNQGDADELKLVAEYYNSESCYEYLNQMQV